MVSLMCPITKDVYLIKNFSAGDGNKLHNKAKICVSGHCFITGSINCSVIMAWPATTLLCIFIFQQNDDSNHCRPHWKPLAGCANDFSKLLFRKEHFEPFYQFLKLFSAIAECTATQKHNTQQQPTCTSYHIIRHVSREK